MRGGGVGGGGNAGAAGVHLRREERRGSVSAAPGPVPRARAPLCREPGEYLFQYVAVMALFVSFVSVF